MVMFPLASRLYITYALLNIPSNGVHRNIYTYTNISYHLIIITKNIPKTNKIICDIYPYIKCLYRLFRILIYAFVIVYLHWTVNHSPHRS